MKLETVECVRATKSETFVALREVLRNLPNAFQITEEKMIVLFCDRRNNRSPIGPFPKLFTRFRG